MSTVSSLESYRTPAFTRPGGPSTGLHATQAPARSGVPQWAAHVGYRPVGNDGAFAPPVSPKPASKLQPEVQVNVELITDGLRNYCEDVGMPSEHQKVFYEIFDGLTGRQLGDLAQAQEVDPLVDYLIDKLNARLGTDYPSTDALQGASESSGVTRWSALKTVAMLFTLLQLPRYVGAQENPVAPYKNVLREGDLFQCTSGARSYCVYPTDPLILPGATLWTEQSRLEPDTSYLYVHRKDGHIVVVPKTAATLGKFGHPEIGSGDDAYIAGTIETNEKGKVYKVDNDSGHYPSGPTRQVVVRGDRCELSTAQQPDALAGFKRTLEQRNIVLAPNCKFTAVDLRPGSDKWKLALEVCQANLKIANGFKAAGMGRDDIDRVAREFQQKKDQQRPDL